MNAASRTATARRRSIVGGASRPCLPRHVRLHFDPVRGQWALLSPEKVMWPDAVSLDILKLCDGERSVDAIARRLADEYDAPLDEIVADVAGFIQEWADRMLVRL